MPTKTLSKPKKQYAPISNMTSSFPEKTSNRGDLVWSKQKGIQRNREPGYGEIQRGSQRNQEPGYGEKNTNLQFVNKKPIFQKKMNTSSKDTSSFPMIQNKPSIKRQAPKSNVRYPLPKSNYYKRYNQ